MQLEAKIALGNVGGRIDHMAVDIKRQRLFVAELGNDTVGVVDLANRSVIRTPQFGAFVVVQFPAASPPRVRGSAAPT